MGLGQCLPFLDCRVFFFEDPIDARRPRASLFMFAPSDCFNPKPFLTLLRHPFSPDSPYDALSYKTPTSDFKNNLNLIWLFLFYSQYISAAGDQLINQQEEFNRAREMFAIRNW